MNRTTVLITTVTARSTDGDNYTPVFGRDCDDDNASVFPGAPELGDDKDNDCDGVIDEGLDRDNDGVLTEDEDVDGDGDPTNDDTDNDGVPNYLDPDDDNDGLQTADELVYGTSAILMDTDGDGLGDQIDGAFVAGVFISEGTITSDLFTDRHLQASDSALWTSGTIVDRGGHEVNVTDALDPGLGLRFVVDDATPQPVRIQIEGKASTVTLAAGTSADITDPDTTTSVYVEVGEATIELVLGGEPVVLVIGEGGTATITETIDENGTLVGLELEVEGEVTFNGEDVEEDATYLAPTNKDQCKQDGWAAFNFPQSFKNQGSCIQFVNTGKWAA
jgi:hypothetical protein